MELEDKVGMDGIIEVVVGERNFGGAWPVWATLRESWL
jgi:hypothetical protein